MRGSYSPQTAKGDHNVLTLSNLNLPLYPHPLQAANCCRNSRLVVDEDELKWVTNEKNILLFLKKYHINLRSKTTRFQEIKSIFRDVK